MVFLPNIIFLAFIYLSHEGLHLDTHSHPSKMKLLLCSNTAVVYSSVNNSQGQEALRLHNPPRGHHRPKAGQLRSCFDGVQRVARGTLHGTGDAA